MTDKPNYNPVEQAKQSFQPPEGNPIEALNDAVERSKGKVYGGEGRDRSSGHWMSPAQIKTLADGLKKAGVSEAAIREALAIEGHKWPS
jgi:hypothetical protein